ncbi:MAG: HlyD family efflux transporter periplasmic adaptor subunit [Gammaproteobacteria bacterium]
MRAAVARRDGARSVRNDAVRERDRLLALVSRNLVSRAEADRQTAVAANAEASLGAAEAELRELQEGTRPEQIERARQTLEQASARLKEQQTTQSRLELRAPRDVIVDALPYRVGEKPVRGATVAVLLETGAPFARVYVPEPIRATVRVGDPATIRIDGVSGTFNGHIRYLATDAEFTPYYALNKGDRVRLVYRAEVVIDGDDALELPAGLPLDVILQSPGAP